MTNMEEDQVNEEARVIMEEHSQQTTPNSNGMCDSHQIHIRQQQQQQQQQQKSSQQQQLQRQATDQSLPMPSTTCGGCRRPIIERFYMKVDKTAWHEECVSCCICNQPLIKFCYVRNGKMYCQQDYQRLQICQRCSEPIRPNEYVFPGPIHIDCNSCGLCNRPLKQGDQYYLTDHKALCPPCKSSRDCNNRADGGGGGGERQDSGSDTDKTDDEAFDSNLNQAGGGYQRQYAPFTPGGSVRPMVMDARGSGGHASPSNPSKSRPIAGSSSSICTTGSGGTDGKRPAGKRPRTILTTAQRRKFKASFEVSQKPCRKVRETLALETGLSPRVVQVWFQNQRAKIKKIARRQTQEEGSTGQNASRNMKRRKKTNDSDSDNETSSPGSYISLPATPHHGGSHLHDTYRSPDSIQTSPPASSDGGTVFFSNMHSHQGIDYVYDEYSGQLQPPPPQQQILSTTALPPPSTCTLGGGNDVSTPSTASSTAQPPPPPNSQNVILYHHDVSHGQSTSELPFPPSLPVHHRGDNNNGQLVPFDYGGGGPVVEVTSPPPPSHHHHHHQYYPPPPPSVTSSGITDNQFAAPVLLGGPVATHGPPGDDTPIDKLLYMQNNYFPT